MMKASKKQFCPFLAKIQKSMHLPLLCERILLSRVNFFDGRLNERETTKKGILRQDNRQHKRQLP